MSAPRTVTVQTIDHGPVTAPEPVWCVARHSDGDYRADLAHEGEGNLLFVDTPCHGPVKVATASLYQRPFAEQSTRAVTVAVEFDASHEFDAASLAGLADALVSWSVGPLHSLIERLQLLEGGE